MKNIAHDSQDQLVTTCMPDIWLILNKPYSTGTLPFWNGTYWFVTFFFIFIIFIMIDGITKVYQSNHVIQYCFWSTFFPVFSSHTTPSSLTTHSSIRIIYKTQEVFSKFWLISTATSIRNKTLSKKTLLKWGFILLEITFRQTCKI